MARTISVPADGRASARAPKRLLALRGDDYLVEQLRGGNEAAFEVVYERHVPGILSFCRHMLGSRDEAEDAVQHAFAAAHRDLLRDDREIRLKPWLYAIARNRCLSMLRARREQPEERLDATTEGLDDEVQRRADLRELVEDLQDLPEDQRAALVLFELRDLSHADVADALGLEVANVKGLVFRARAGLIDRREARSAACEEIQQELATARGGSLRRGRLRHHLRSCSPCTTYFEQVRAQRKMMAVILPVVPTLGLKKGVLAAVGIGGGASGGGGAAVGGGGLLATALPAGGATVAKVAVIGALVGGGGVAGEAAIGGDGPSADSASRAAPERAAGAQGAWTRAVTPGTADQRPTATSERGENLREQKQRKARGRGQGHAKKPKARGPVAAVPRKLGHAKPKKVQPRRPAQAPARPVRPLQPQRVRVPSRRPTNAAPVREPRQKVVPGPTPLVPPVPNPRRPPVP